MLILQYLYCVLLLSILKQTQAKRKHINSVVDVETWKGKWFPFSPNLPESKKIHEKALLYACDDTMNSIGIDFNPKDKRQSYHYLCLETNRTKYDPDLNREAILEEHYVSAVYVPPIKCLNETISYETQLPTFGSFRLFAPKYGEYKYLPPQRWLRSLADGAIVMLYHPCAFSGQITALQNILKGCLYRHIITPTQGLTPERPLALMAWGKCLQMSVVNEAIITNFIRKNANRGALTKHNIPKNNITYDGGLLAEAHLITDVKDDLLCGFKEM